MQAAYQAQSIQSPAKTQEIDNRIRASQIPGVLGTFNSLEEEIATLGTVADDLIVRLNGVMHSDSPSPADPRPTERQATCDLDTALHQRLLSVRVIRERLANALSRLEI